MSESIIARPLPWEEYVSGLFRLPGFGGAALFLRSVIVPSIHDESIASLALDVGLLSPQSFTRRLGRPITLGLPEQLSAFFLAAASDWQPETSVPAVNDDVLGLRLAVTDSDSERITLLVSVHEDPEQPSDDPDGLDFQTSRAALAQAAADVRCLDHVEADMGGVSEPPVDWSTS